MIPIKQEPGALWHEPAERCCFCRVVTRTWTALPERKAGEQVACCAGCAADKAPADVPTKDAWFAAERAARTSLAAANRRDGGL